MLNALSDHSALLDEKVALCSPGDFMVKSKLKGEFMKIKDKVVVVTGAASGIGRGFRRRAAPKPLMRCGSARGIFMSWPMSMQPAPFCRP
jgi:hypothetical protein